MTSDPSNTYERLRQYIAERMRMSHVYQPLMLMELLGRRSPAPAQDVARRILGEDVTQIEYYTERVKRMVGKVLTGNGITRCEKGTYALVGGEELSDAERDQLLDLCRQRLDAFREQRGEEVFAHRSRNRTPINGSIKYRVLTRAKGRCEQALAAWRNSDRAERRYWQGEQEVKRQRSAARQLQAEKALLALGVGNTAAHRNAWSRCDAKQLAAVALP